MFLLEKPVMTYDLIVIIWIRPIYFYLYPFVLNEWEELKTEKKNFYKVVSFHVSLISNRNISYNIYIFSFPKEGQKSYKWLL